MNNEGKPFFQGDPNKLGFTYNFNYSSVTTGTTVDSTIPEQWSKELEDYVKGRRFLSRFVVEKTDLIRQPGDIIRVHKRAALSAAGDLAETTQLVGNEEKMSFSEVTFTPAERGNAVAWTLQATSKSIFDLRKEAQLLLGDWAATKIDSDLHTAAQLVSSKIYGSGAASQAAMTSASKLIPSDVSKAKYTLMKNNVPGFGKVNPDEPGPDGMGYYIMIARPEQIYDLTRHSDYMTAASQLGVEAAKVSNVFEGFRAYWDGVLIYDTTQIYFQDPAAYGFKVAKSFMFGPRFLARANGIFATGPGFTWNEEMFDYGRTVGIAVRWYDQAKILNADRGIGIYTAATEL